MNDCVLSTLRLYAFRISKLSDLELDTTFNHMKSHYKWLVISQETNPSLHLHGVIGINRPDTDKQEKARIRSVIQSLYPKAVGNKHLYTANVLKKKQIFKYTLKEGNFVHQGFTNEFITDMFKTSTPKENLGDKVKQNEEQFLLGKITFQDFKENYVKIKVEHNQRLYPNHIRAYFNIFMLKSGNMTIEDYITVMEL